MVGFEFLLIVCCICSDESDVVVLLCDSGVL